MSVSLYFILRFHFLSSKHLFFEALFFLLNRGLLKPYTRDSQLRRQIFQADQRRATFSQGSPQIWLTHVDRLRPDSPQKTHVFSEAGCHSKIEFECLEICWNCVFVLPRNREKHSHKPTPVFSHSPPKKSGEVVSLWHEKSWWHLWTTASWKNHQKNKLPHPRLWQPATGWRPPHQRVAKLQESDGVTYLGWLIFKTSFGISMTESGTLKLWGWYTHTHTHTSGTSLSVVFFFFDGGMVYSLICTEMVVCIYMWNW